jgi:hypothetical protein
MFQECRPLGSRLFQGKVEQGFVAHCGFPGSDAMVSESNSAKRPSKASRDFQKIS